MILTFFGIVSVIIASFLHDSYNNSTSHNQYHIYLFIMLVALLLYSFQKIGEEYILQKAEFATRRFVGLQGVLGIAIISVFQIIIVLIVSFKKDHTDQVYQFLSNFMGGHSLMNIGKSKILIFIISRCHFGHYHHLMHCFCHNLRIFWDYCHKKGIFNLQSHHRNL